MSKAGQRIFACAFLGFPIGIALMSSKEAEAIPAWSRKYGIECSSCHFGGTNRLTPLGRDFLWRGHRMKDTENVKDTGGDIKLMEYMSFASKVRFEAAKDDDPSTKFDVESLSIYSGGPLFDNYSYFFEIYLHERGKESNSTGTGSIDTATREKLAEAYLYYNSNPMGDSYWFARAGQYTPRVIHTASTGGRTSISRPAILNDNAGGNLFTPRDRFYGATFGFVSKDSLYSEFGITNGGGGNARPNQPENNEPKDYWGTIEKVLDTEGSSVGLYGYSGVYPITGPPAFEDKFTRIGIVGALNRENYEISGGYFFGKNDLPTGGARDPKGYFVEAALNSSPKVTWYGRYDFTDFDLGSKKTGATIGASVRLSQLGRMVFEVSDTKVTGSGSRKKLTMELNWLF